MNAPMMEELEWVKFNPGPKCDILKYGDNTDGFRLSEAQMDHVVSQGNGTGAVFAPVFFTVRGTLAQYTRFSKMVAQNDKTVTSFDYKSQHTMSNKRKDKVKVTYEGLTFLSANKRPMAGSKDVFIDLSVSYRKRKGKVFDYDEKGTAKPGEDIDDDLDTGKFL